MKTFATAGTFESNDCIVTVKKSDTLKIEIESVVFEQFGAQIDLVARQTLKEMDINQIHLYIKDKGALDYTVIARIKTACKRLGVYHA
ncbi:MAG: citrate lyase acyl carrier protein [Acholeplasmataceae bacterium]|nr:citrate lyase acyl carrier protein [Acholeplasmataceae bacterium]